MDYYHGLLATEMDYKAHQNDRRAARGGDDEEDGKAPAKATGKKKAKNAP